MDNANLSDQHPCCFWIASQLPFFCFAKPQRWRGKMKSLNARKFEAYHLVRRWSRDLFGLLYHTCCWFPRLFLRLLARLKLPAVFMCSLELQFNFECYTQHIIFAMVQNDKIVDLRPVRVNLPGSKNIFFHFKCFHFFSKVYFPFPVFFVWDRPCISLPHYFSPLIATSGMLATARISFEWTRTSPLCHTVSALRHSLFVQRKGPGPEEHPRGTKSCKPTD